MRIAAALVVLTTLASCSAMSYAVSDSPDTDLLGTNFPGTDSAPSTPQSYAQIQAAGPAKPMGYAQGMIGESTSKIDSLDIDNSLASFVDSDDITAPFLAGAFQKKLGGDKIGIGLEGGLALNWNADVVAISAGGGGLAIAADTNSFLADFFGGVYADTLLGRARFYAAAGPSLQWGVLDLDWSDAGGFHSVHEDGFGFGWYGRAGFEYLVQPGMWIGIGGRYVDATVDFSGSLGDLDYTAEQWFVTFTNSI